MRLQLAATVMGVNVQPLSQRLQEFVEMKPFVEQAHQLLIDKSAPRRPTEETVPMFCRLRYPPERVPATPRRALKDFMQSS